jgi:hypothetical protein
VKCRSCGHEIAANAIVCYRCGTPTAFDTPARPSAAHTPGNRRLSLIVTVVAVVIVAAALVIGLARHLL